MHTHVSPRVFDVKNPIACKHYLQCLSRFPYAGESESPFELPSGQPNRYYSCVLACGHPAQVPVGQSAASYRKLLANTDTVPSVGCIAAVAAGADGRLSYGSSSGAFMSIRPGGRIPQGSHQAVVPAKRARQHDVGWDGLVLQACRPVGGTQGRREESPDRSAATGARSSGPVAQSAVHDIAGAGAVHTWRRRGRGF